MLLWPFNKYPGTDYETFNWEWIIKTIKELQKKVDSWIVDWKSYVLEILSDHPEWIQDWMLADGTVTKPKFENNTWNLVENAYTNAKKYGVVGDGVTDDTEAIQAAVDDADGVLWFPAGTYIITKPIIVSKSWLTIKGNGVTSTVFKKVGTDTSVSLVFSVNGTSYDLTGIDAAFITAPENGSSSSSRSQAVTFEDFSLERTVQNTTSYGIYSTYMAYTRYNNIRILYAGTGIYIDHSHTTTIDGAQILSSQNASLVMDSDTSMLINNSFMKNDGGSYVVVANGTFAEFTDCAIDNKSAMRCYNGSLIQMNGCRTESEEYILIAESSRIVADSCNFERHKTASANENSACFVANDNASVVVSNSICRWQNYTSYEDPANIRLYNSVDNSVVRIEAVFKDWPTLTYQRSGASSGRVVHNETPRQNNQNESSAGTIEFASDITLGGASRYYLRQYGSAVVLDLQIQMTAGKPTAGTAKQIATLSGIPLPSETRRLQCAAGEHLYDPVTSSYASIEPSGALSVLVPSGQTGCIVLHDVWFVDQNIV